MAISFKLPRALEEQLRDADPRLDDSARDQFLINGYNSGKLSTSDIAETLGLSSRFEAEKWLADRGVRLNYAIADLEADRAALDRLLGSVKR